MLAVTGVQGTLLGSHNAHALEETGVFRGCLWQGVFGVRSGTFLGALGQAFADEQDAAACRAPVVDDHLPVAGKPDFENAVRSFSAITGKRKCAITHGSVIA